MLADIAIGRLGVAALTQRKTSLKWAQVCTHTLSYRFIAKVVKDLFEDGVEMQSIVFCVI